MEADCPHCGTKIAEFNPAPGVRLVVTAPPHATPLTIRTIIESMKREFPDHPIICKTPDMELDADA